MNNLQRRPEQEPDALLYDPKCAIQSPEVVRSWAIDLGISPKDYTKLIDEFGENSEGIMNRGIRKGFKVLTISLTYSQSYLHPKWFSYDIESR